MRCAYSEIDQQFKTKHILEYNPDQLDREVKELFNKSNVLEIRFTKELNLKNPAEVAKQVYNGLNINRPYIPLIAYLCTEGLKERHWNEIFEVLNIDESAKAEIAEEGTDIKQILTIQDVQKYMGDAKEALPKLEEISDTAAKEYKNENMLANMKKDWQPAEFGCKVYKDTFILDGEAIDVIQTLLDDHIIKTQTMKGSPYARHILAETLQWEQDLMNTQDYLDAWLKVQSKWLYLEPVFSSEDIQNQMKNEGRWFKEINQEWRHLMNEVKENSSALVVIKISKLGERLNTMLEQLEKVLGGLNQYLQSKRGKFPRFFFLSDGELLEILSETKEPLKVQPHLKKCFEGINELDFDSEKKIHGMYSSEKENVPFTTIIDPV